MTEPLGWVAAAFLAAIWAAGTAAQLTVPKADRPERWPLGALMWPLLTASAVVLVVVELLRHWWARPRG